jgi:N,N'-diacetyllegionaminate synthase
MISNFLAFQGVFFIAEIGGNHEGSFEYAKKLLDHAIQSGAQAVKFQTYKADTIVSKVESKERNQHFKRFELSIAQFIELYSIAKKNNVQFMSSVWDVESFEALDPYIEIHKVGSGDLTNYQMLRVLALTNKPIILSTAMSTIEEIRDSVAFINSINPKLVENRKLALLHCVAMYGEALDQYANLQSIRVMQDAFSGIPIGYSDHTVGTYACELAIGLGSVIIEKHFTDDKTRSFRDHQISATTSEIKDLIQKSKKIQTLLGEYKKTPISQIETVERIKEFRRAVYLIKDLPAGTILSEEHLIALRPNIGIDARSYFDLLGKKLLVEKKAYQALSESEIS